ncbi:PAS domain-containing sensor histidine kinase [Ramlibacter sp.]|uniref:PAS domain-containing sensor histidine kinase n=1 Tax=Ramlibacter sp. TaxID=1917967 RepID=UPI0026144944|nr:PAS domain-containing sensor histidine kinase [Ramlibacter sp.]MDB5958077.1 chemotaxis protein methyltransferase CheR [Ramlibacter sp.]
MRDSDPGRLPPVSRTLALWLQQSRDLAVIVLDPSGIVTEWLGAAPTTLGYLPQETVGRHIALIFTEEDRARGYPDYELKVAADDSFSEDSRWHVRKDGTRIWATGSVSAVREASRVVGFVKVLRDMTDQRAHTERFENEVSQLGQAREQTRSFLRTLGHEIRNPLSVLNNISVILERLVQDPRVTRTLQQLSTQIGVLKRLADDLMDVNRLELGKVKLDPERIDLRTLLEETVAGMQELAGEKGLQLEAVLPPSALMVDADVARLQQVVVNLLNNAIKYTPAGGTVWVRAIQEGAEIVCRIQDTGIGIPPAMLPRIFELFTQAEEGESMREGGIGMGLALVQQLVELHGGSVQAKSSGAGKGSEFSFRLPAR